MLVAICPVRVMAHQIHAMDMLADCLIREGHEIVVCEKAGPEVDFAVVWGKKNEHRANGRPWLCLEAGYINGNTGDYHVDRRRFISTGWCGMHGRAYPTPVRPSDRWDALNIELVPWRMGGRYALILGQHPGDAASAGCRPDEITEQALSVYDKVRVRPHPLLNPNLRTLADDLEGARVAITWNSTAAVEAVIAGIPTVTLDEGSIAWPVTSHVVGETYTGSREMWCYNLAYRQWTHDELRSGEAWETIKHGIDP